MDLALFSEVPVPRPWQPDSEQLRFRELIEQAVLADQLGYHSFWTVEHHFLEEMSHSSNPEVLYGAVAALTEQIRLGYGVRLTPKPYNHPVRSAESAATLDVVSGGRVEFGTGRSTTRAELEGFGIDPRETRAMWAEAVEHIAGCWMNDEHEFQGRYWSMPRRRVLPKPVQKPHPPLWAATGSRETHQLVGEMGMGLLSFSAGVSLEELALRVNLYREAVEACQNPVGGYVNDRVATFAMYHCAPTTAEAYENARESFWWYPTVAFKLVGSVAEMLQEEGADLGDWNYLRYLPGMTQEADWDTTFSVEDLVDQGVAIAGDPDQCIELCQGFADLGVDLLLCMMNPYAIPHDKVMESLRLTATHVMPALNR